MRCECVSPGFLWSSSQTPCWEHWRCSPERSNKACSSGRVCVWGVCVRHLRIPVPSPHEGLQSHSLWKRKMIHWSVEWFFRWSMNHVINEQPEFDVEQYPALWQSAQLTLWMRGKQTCQHLEKHLRVIYQAFWIWRSTLYTYALFNSSWHLYVIWTGSLHQALYSMTLALQELSEPAFCFQQ